MKFALDRVDWRCFGFMPPTMLARIEAQDKAEKDACYERLVKAGQVEDWDELKTKFKPALVLNGKTYSPLQLWPLEPYRLSKKKPVPANAVSCPGSEFAYYHRLLPAKTALQTVQGNKRGYVWFTDDVVIPTLCTMQLKPQVWMSMTPMEMFSQRAGIKMATDTVLVGGLGLGWLLNKVCQKPSVKRVIVVEKDQALLNWISGRLQEICPDVKAKVTDWVCGNALEHVGKHGDDTRYLLDIWPEYGDFSYCFEQLSHSVKYLWGWGQSRSRT